MASPMKAHVDAFAAFDFDGIIGKTDRTLVITKDLGGRLWIAYGSQHCTCPDTVLGIEVDGAIFTFSGRTDHHIKQRADREQRPIEHAGINERAKVAKTTDNRTCFGSRG